MSKNALFRAQAAQWAGVIAFYFVLLTSFGWPEDQAVAMPAVLASGFASLANTLPVNGFAGFGTENAPPDRVDFFDKAVAVDGKQAVGN